MPRLTIGLRADETGGPHTHKEGRKDDVKLPGQRGRRLKQSAGCKLQAGQDKASGSLWGTVWERPQSGISDQEKTHKR